jgi:hypothetical protein
MSGCLTFAVTVNHASANENDVQQNLHDGYANDHQKKNQ